MRIPFPARRAALLSGSALWLVAALAGCGRRDTSQPAALDTTGAGDSARGRTPADSPVSARPSAGTAALAGFAADTPPPAAKPAPSATKPKAQPAKPAAQAQAADSGGSGQSAANPSGGHAAKPAGGDQWVSYDAATKTTTFKLVAGPFVWNGYGNGGATLTVPPGSDVVVNFVQDDGTPHSAEVSSGEGPIPNAGGDPAIPRAYTNKVIEGLPQGATDVVRFSTPEGGSYRIICGVPGHALSGMWIWFKVDPAATQPSFGPTKG
jgi:hypothetical protein